MKTAEEILKEIYTKATKDKSQWETWDNAIKNKNMLEGIDICIKAMEAYASQFAPTETVNNRLVEATEENTKNWMREKYKLVDFHNLTINGYSWLKLMAEFANENPVLEINTKAQEAIKQALECLKELVDGLNGTEFPMGIWERAEFNMMVKLRESLRKAESALSSVPSSTTNK